LKKLTRTTTSIYVQAKKKKSKASKSKLPSISSKNLYNFKSADDAAKWGSVLTTIKSAYNSKSKKDIALKKQAKSKVNALYKSFRSTYKKKFSSNASKNFKNSLFQIADINNQATKTGWWAAVNEYADMTFQEFASKQLISLPELKVDKSRIVTDFKSEAAVLHCLAPEQRGTHSILIQRVCCCPQVIPSGANST